MQLGAQLQKSLQAQCDAGDTIDINRLVHIFKTLIPISTQSMLWNIDI